jgi:hypothetical protein
LPPLGRADLLHFAMHFTKLRSTVSEFKSPVNGKAAAAAQKWKEEHTFSLVACAIWMLYSKYLKESRSSHSSSTTNKQRQKEAHSDRTCTEKRRESKMLFDVGEFPQQLRVLGLECSYSLQQLLPRLTVLRTIALGRD